MKKKQKKAKKKAKKAAKGQVDRGDGVVVNIGKANPFMILFIQKQSLKLILERKSDIPSDPPSHFLTRVNSDDEGDEKKKRPEREEREDKPRERRERKDDSGRKIKGA